MTQDQTAFLTLPERMQRVQAQIRLTPVGVSAFTRWRFGLHFFLEALCEWLRLCPKIGPFPQISHVLGIVRLFSYWLWNQIYTTKREKSQHPARGTRCRRGGARRIRAPDVNNIYRSGAAGRVGERSPLSYICPLFGTAPGLFPRALLPAVLV